MRSTRTEINKTHLLCGVLQTSMAAAMSVASLTFVTPEVFAQNVNDVNGASSSGTSSPSLSSSSTVPGTETKELSIDDLVAKSIAAYGGAQALKQVERNASIFGLRKDLAANVAAVNFRQLQKSLRWRIDVDNASTAEVKKPDAAASSAANPTTETKDEPHLKNNSSVYAFDGVVPWQSNGRTTTEMAPDEYNRISAEVLKQPFILCHFQQPGYTFVLRGRTQYKQTPVFAIEIKMIGQKGLTTVFLDQNNYLIVAEVTSFDDSGDATKNLSVEYSEYRPVAGTLWPFKQVLTLGGLEVAQYDLTSVDVNSDILESVFNRPDMGPAVRLSREIVTPFDYSQREILIKGRVNGGDELEFLFDTGASDTLIDRRVAAEAFLPKQGEFDVAAASGIVATRTSNVKRLELGKLIVNDVPVRIIDLSSQSKHLGRQIAGIIGTNVISKFFTTIDYSKPSITFGDLESTPRPANAVPLNFQANATPFVLASLNGKDSQILLVDTGAAFNHLPASIGKKYASGDPSAMKHFTEGTGLDGQPMRLGLVTLDNVGVNGFNIKKVTFTYPQQEAPGTEGGGAKSKSLTKGGFFQGTNIGILGNPFWQNFIVSIDWKYQRLLIQNNPVFKVRDEIERNLATGDNSLVLHRDYRLAEQAYQKAMLVANNSGDAKAQAKLLGRLGNLRRLMAKDLGRPEHSKAAYDYFSSGVEKAQKIKASEIEGRILADWSLLYSDNNQLPEAKQTIDRAIVLAPDDATVNVDCAVQLYRAKLFPEMQKYVEKALFLDPDNWQALWYQVKLSEQFGDTTKAISVLKEISRYYPWSKLAQDKIKQLSAPAAPLTSAPTGPAASVATPSSGASSADQMPKGANTPAPSALKTRMFIRNP